MSIENPNFFENQPYPEDTPEQVEEVGRITPDRCAGHFKFEDGPRIEPAFHMCEELTRRVAETGDLLSNVHLNIAGVFPEGVKYTSTYLSPDPRYGVHTLTWEMKPHGKVTMYGTTAPGIFVNQLTTIDPAESTEIPAEKIWLDENAISEIIPQGHEIQFIETVLKPETTNPGVKASGVHQVNPSDYVQVNQKFYFNHSRLLEGFGQLADIYFEQTLKPTESTIPFFKEVDIDIKRGYCPQVGENIQYQLTGFATDFEKRGYKGQGFVTGRVLAGDGKTVMAKFTASVGTMKRSILAYQVKKIAQWAAKAEEAEQDPTIDSPDQA